MKGMLVVAVVFAARVNGFANYMSGGFFGRVQKQHIGAKVLSQAKTSDSNVVSKASKRDVVWIDDDGTTCHNLVMEKEKEEHDDDKTNSGWQVRVRTFNITGNKSQLLHELPTVDCFSVTDAESHFEALFQKFVGVAWQHRDMQSELISFAPGVTLGMLQGMLHNPTIQILLDGSSLYTGAPVGKLLMQDDRSHRLVVEDETKQLYDMVAVNHDEDHGLMFDKYYLMQLVESDKDDDNDEVEYQVWTRWGAVGHRVGFAQVLKFASLEEAVARFETKFREKLGVTWQLSNDRTVATDNKYYNRRFSLMDDDDARDVLLTTGNGEVLALSFGARIKRRSHDLEYSIENTLYESGVKVSSSSDMDMDLAVVDARFRQLFHRLTGFEWDERHGTHEDVEGDYQYRGPGIPAAQFAGYAINPTIWTNITSVLDVSNGALQDVDEELSSLPQFNTIASLDGDLASVMLVATGEDDHYDNYEKGQPKQFYSIQMVHSEDDQFALVTRWGLVGYPGVMQVLQFEDSIEAEKKFARKFRDKTGKLWSERYDSDKDGDDKRSNKGKYTPVNPYKERDSVDKTVDDPAPLGVVDHISNIPGSIVLDDGEPLDAMMALVDPAKNLDKFFVLQLIQEDLTKFTVFSRSGDTGSNGVASIESFVSAAEAKFAFFGIIEEKLGYCWKDRFNPTKGDKYRFVAQDFAAKQLQYTGGQWQYWVDDSVDGKSIGWYNYTTKGGRHVEQLFTEKNFNMNLENRIVQSGQYKYNVDLAQMIQTNAEHSDHTSRRIRRLSDPPPKASKATTMPPLRHDGTDSTTHSDTDNDGTESDSNEATTSDTDLPDGDDETVAVLDTISVSEQPNDVDPSQLDVTGLSATDNEERSSFADVGGDSLNEEVRPQEHGTSNDDATENTVSSVGTASLLVEDEEPLHTDIAADATTDEPDLPEHDTPDASAPNDMMNINTTASLVAEEDEGGSHRTDIVVGDSSDGNETDLQEQDSSENDSVETEDTIGGDDTAPLVIEQKEAGSLPASIVADEQADPQEDDTSKDDAAETDDSNDATVTTNVKVNGPELDEPNNTSKEGETHIVDPDIYVQRPRSDKFEVVYDASCNKWFDSVLNQCDIGVNSNKFYRLQLVRNTGDGTHWVWSKWGRVGDSTKHSSCAIIGPITSLGDAKKFFRSKYRSKTGNDFMSSNFVMKTFKYAPVDIDYEASFKEQKQVDRDTDVSISSCTLDETTQHLIELLFSGETRDEVLSSFGIDLKRLPLGVPSKQQIHAGIAILDDIGDLLDGLDGTESSSYKELSSRFYTTIPHSYGRRNRPPTIDSRTRLQEKYDMCNVLLDMFSTSEAVKDIERERPKVELPHPADEFYGSLNAKLELLSSDSSDYKMIDTYFEKTKQRGKLRHVWTLERAGEKAVHHEAHEALGNRKLLWHGTNIAIVAPILTQGLRIMPHSGGRVGAGIYMASMNCKAASYTSRSTDYSCMFLCEAALGHIHNISHDDYSLKRAPDGSDSVLAVGNTSPEIWEPMELDGNPVLVPQSEGEFCAEKGSSFAHDEYVLYDQKQVRLRYLVAAEI